MLTYELAKELKDNGFPQKDLYCLDEDTHPDATIEEYRYLNVGRVRYEGYYCPALTNEEQHTDEDDIYIPTLSELIEACGEKYFSLYFDMSDNTWRAKKNDYLGSGESTETAVANLWLGLNKKARNKIDETDYIKRATAVMFREINNNL